MVPYEQESRDFVDIRFEISLQFGIVNFYFLQLATESTKSCAIQELLYCHNGTT